MTLPILGDRRRRRHAKRAAAPFGVFGGHPHLPSARHGRSQQGTPATQGCACCTQQVPGTQVVLPAKQQIVPGAQNRLPSHCPFVQTSLIVQMLRSSQGVLLGRVWVTQAPVAGLQVLVWQGLVGAGQVFSEPVVQVPVAGSQTPAVWHRLLAEHTTGLRPVQTPDWQVSV